VIDKFLRDGWCISEIPNLAVIYEILDFLGEGEIPIEKHKELSEGFWKREFSIGLAGALLPVVRKFFGLDVMVQYYPYLRIVRPGKREDNIGYHKDTQYGQNPYEIAVHIPFVDLDKKSAIRVISGSHLMPEKLFTCVTPEGPRIEKGSIENQMGRPYAPKCLKIPDGMQTTPLNMRVGEYAIFSPALFHGQEVNEGDITRVSCDLRFISARAPVEIRKGKIHAGYVPVSQSPVEIIAEEYYQSQRE